MSMVDLSVKEVRSIDCSHMVTPLNLMNATDYAMILMAGMASRAMVTLNECGAIIRVPKKSVIKVEQYVSRNGFSNVIVLPLCKPMKTGKLDISVKMPGFIHETKCDFVIAN